MYTAEAFRAQFIRFRPGDPRVRIAAWYEAQLGLDPDEAASRATQDFARSMARAYATGGVRYRDLGDCIGVTVCRAREIAQKGERLQRRHEAEEACDFPLLPYELRINRSRARRLLRQLEGVTITLS